MMQPSHEQLVHSLPVIERTTKIKQIAEVMNQNENDQSHFNERTNIYIFIYPKQRFHFSLHTIDRTMKRLFSLVEIN